VRTLERSLLEQAGFEVEVAEDGEQALATLERAEVPFDAVVSDVTMPRLDGVGLCSAIRRNPRLAPLPVVLVTSLSGDEDRARGRTAGATEYLVKGEADPDVLVAALRRHLR
jgi:two-component system chemotaxis sensor kinase CheA